MEKIGHPWSETIVNVPLKIFQKKYPLKDDIRKKGKSSLNMAVMCRMAFPIFILKQGLIHKSINYWNFTLAPGKKYYN
jgi:hypothetical protein